MALEKTEQRRCFLDLLQPLSYDVYEPRNFWGQNHFGHLAHSTLKGIQSKLKKISIRPLQGEKGIHQGFRMYFI